jgi:hypothetical protein
MECPEGIAVGTIVNQLPCFGDSVGMIEFVYSGLQGDGTIQLEGMLDQLTYEISDQDVSFFVEGLSGGLYLFSITDSLGCVQSGSVELTDPDPLWCEAYSGNEEMGNDGWVCADATGGTGELLYAWSNGSEDSCVEQIAAGVYSVVVTDENGCTCEQTVEVYTGIENGMEIYEDLLLWPNPAHDIFFVKPERQLSPVSICISDAAGRILMREEDWEFAPIDISHLAEGCYHISLLSGEKRYSAMFAVIR